MISYTVLLIAYLIVGILYTAYLCYRNGLPFVRELYLLPLTVVVWPLVVYAYWAGHFDGDD